MNHALHYSYIVLSSHAMSSHCLPDFGKITFFLLILYFFFLKFSIYLSFYFFLFSLVPIAFFGNFLGYIVAF